VALRLVTGPANAAKAGIVLGDFRARLAEAPILVVPAFQAVEHSQREMAARGAVFGVSVMRFDHFAAELAKRAGVRGRIASEVQRELAVEDAAAAAKLRVLARSASRPGFVTAALRFVDEIAAAGLEPERFSAALAEWRPGNRYAEELGLIYAGYRRALDAAGLVDRATEAWGALSALRREPRLFGGSPVFFYGFDDFTELQLDAIETLAGNAGADVTVSLPYERGRVAFRAVAAVFERLRAAAAEHVELEPTDEHYESESRPVLAHVERSLYADEPERVDPGGAVRRLRAAGRRAEVEQVGAEVLRLLRSGTRPGDVAVVFRDPSDYGSLVEQVFTAYGVPHSIDRRVELRHTALGRGLLALMRAATPEGTADDLLAYLRTPGLVDGAHVIDKLEAEVRRNGERTAEQARERLGWDLDALDELASAAGPAEYLERLERRIEWMFARPYQRSGRTLEQHEIADAAVYVAARSAIGDMLAVARAGGGERLDAQEILGRQRVRIGEREQPGRVQVTRPEDLRGRRFDTVFVCGLQEGEFPRRVGPEPFLSDEERRELNAATGLRLPVREDQLDRERYLFYVAASRAERRLVLSHRRTNEEGRPELASFFLADIDDIVAGNSEPGEDGRARPDAERTLVDVTWDGAAAPTLVEWRRAEALALHDMDPRTPDGIADPDALADLVGEGPFSASALETFADCPIQWLMRRIEPQSLEPDPDYIVRGAYAHEVLRTTFERLRDEHGSARVTRATLPDAERILLAALAEHAESFPISPQQTRVRAAVRRLEFDLLRLLRAEAESDSVFEPSDFELDFEVPLDVGDGDEIRLRGRIDRVDRHGAWALVRDYKAGKSAHSRADWIRSNRIQVAVYMLALSAAEGGRTKLAGGVYAPLAGSRPRPRGAIAEDVRDELGDHDWVRTDWLPAEELATLLEEARERIGTLFRRMRAGDIRPCPKTCSFGRDGCRYPAICRVEG